MMRSDFPTDHFVTRADSVLVRYTADATTSSSRFSLGGKKADKKLRHVEIARSHDRYYILVYKVKKNTNVPFFKVELTENSVVKRGGKSRDFTFFVDTEDMATFHLEDSATRNEWVKAINGIV